MEPSYSLRANKRTAPIWLRAVLAIVAGIACAAVTPKARWPVYVFALLLLALFVPVHVSLWDKFPIWYHIVFLGSLFPLVLFGAKLLGSRGPGAA